MWRSAIKPWARLPAPGPAELAEAGAAELRSVAADSSVPGNNGGGHSPRGMTRLAPAGPGASRPAPRPSPRQRAGVAAPPLGIPRGGARAPARLFGVTSCAASGDPCRKRGEGSSGSPAAPRRGHGGGVSLQTQRRRRRPAARPLLPVERLPEVRLPLLPTHTHTQPGGPGEAIRVLCRPNGCRPEGNPGRRALLGRGSLCPPR